LTRFGFVRLDRHAVIYDRRSHIIVEVAVLF